MLPQLKPMSVRMGEEAFDDEGYIFEPKWDGGRLLIYKSHDRIDAYTRTGKRVTQQFPELQEAAKAIDHKEIILDVEGVCLRGGRPVFDDFAYRGRISIQARIDQATWTHPVTFVVFDVLHAGLSLLREPLMARKRHLAELVGATSVITPTIFVEKEGKALFGLTHEKDMEGIVAKHKEGIYFPGQPSPDWLKIKHRRTVDTVILGYRSDPGFALIVGLHFRTMRNKPVSIVELGFTAEDKERFLALAAGLHTKKEGEMQWLEPQLCCRIDYLDRTDMHQLQHAIFRGLLPEKKPEQCSWSYA